MNMDEDEDIQVDIESLALLLEERGEKDPYATAKEMVERAREASNNNEV